MNDEWAPEKTKQHLKSIINVVYVTHAHAYIPTLLKAYNSFVWGTHSEFRSKFTNISHILYITYQIYHIYHKYIA